MSQQAEAALVRFEAVPRAIDGFTVLRLPQAASKQLPSRGQVAVSGTINGRAFDTVVEPDGGSGHFIKVDAALRTAASLTTGDTASVEIAPRRDWPEPSVPADLRAALAAAPAPIQQLWREITPMARWEWVRWVNETRNPATRRRRVEVTISKLSSGKRRPCCFNLAACTDPDLARSGKLVEPAWPEGAA
ncbi:MAG: YdeI/OmpD-associated family protein [Candidatus Dormibacteria bacterium]